MIALMSYLRGEMIKRNSFIEDLDAAVKRAREKEDWKVEYMKNTKKCIWNKMKRNSIHDVARRFLRAFVIFL